MHTYGTVMHGFSVRHTDDEARRMSRTPGVSGVYKSRVRYTHMTRSPEFMGLNETFGAWHDSNFGDGIIIGFIDTGIWPESASFNDTGLGPVRSTWKGMCVCWCSPRLHPLFLGPLPSHEQGQEVGDDD
jgi:hypothetical protein